MNDKKQKKKRGKARIIIPIIIIFIVIITLVGIFTRGGSALREVEANTVETATLEREVSANGQIDAQESTKVLAQISGTVDRVLVSVGEEVKNNQLLAVLDKRKILIQQKSALTALESARKQVMRELITLRTSYNNAKTTYEQTLRSYENTKDLYSIGSVNEEDLALAEDNLVIAQESLSSALKQLNFREGRPSDDPRETAPVDDETIIENSIEVRQAKDQIDSINNDLLDCDIHASLGGIITAFNIEQGSVVGPGSELAVIHNQEQKEAIVNIDEVDIGFIEIGQVARIESDAFLNHTLSGKVSEIAPIIQRIGDARVCEIKISLQDPQKVAKIGASCSIYITVEKKENVPAIPIESYLQEENSKYVFLLTMSDEKQQTYQAKKIEIQTGIVGIELVEVVSGIKAGDIILKNNLKQFTDGVKVKIKLEQKTEKSE
jgi:HlyD family secretion protein